MNYIESVTKAIAYIEEHLSEEIGTEAVAKFVGYSPYHFHRVFQSVTRSSVPDYISVADPAKVQYRTIENAGHYSFLSPFPESMASASFPPSQDPPGFDRTQFHETLNAEVLHFLKHAG